MDTKSVPDRSPTARAGRGILKTSWTRLASLRPPARRHAHFRSPITRDRRPAESSSKCRGRLGRTLCSDVRNRAVRSLDGKAWSVRQPTWTLSVAVELATRALTGPSLRRSAPTKQGPFPHRRLCCPSGSTSYDPLRTPTRHDTRFPAETGYRTRRPGSTRRPPGRPSSRRHLLNVPRPHTPESPSRLCFQALHRFHGLHPDSPGSALPDPTRRRG
jgi:hypothetical protein